MTKHYHLLLLLLLFGFTSFAQEYREQRVWNSIETSIKDKINLRDTRKKVQLLKEQIIHNRDYTALARFYYYGMLIDDRLTEDTLYFTNSSFIDSILYDANSPGELKTLMHIMQASRLIEFRNKPHPFNAALYNSRRNKFNYAGISINKLDSIIRYHFQQAKAGAPGNHSFVENLVWMSSNPFLFLFKPDLTDIVYGEEIAFLKANISEDYNISEERALLILKTEEGTARVLDSMVKVGDALPLTLLRYYEWMQYHKGDSNAFYFKDALLRRYIASRFTENKEVMEAYEKFLSRNIYSDLPEVKAHCIYELCSFWHIRGNEYQKNPYENLDPDYRGMGIIKWDTSCQYLPAKALALFDANRKIFERYGQLMDRLNYMEKDILSKQLEWRMDDEGIPGIPILIRLKYKNVASVYYKIVKVGTNEKLPFSDKNLISYLSRKTSVVEKRQLLPLPGDNNRHTAFMKLEPLAAGEYYVLFSDNQIEPENTSVSHTSFIVTSIAAISTDKRVYILDRKTGQPLEGASVKAFYEKKSVKDSISVIKQRNFKVNKDGFFDRDATREYDLQISYKGDTLLYDVNAEDSYEPENVYSKEEYDDLTDYYDNNISINIFTDRSIYRPGQKVYYKAIFMVRNPKSGKKELMNTHNMRHGLFGNYLKKWVKENKPFLYMEDVFRKLIDSVKIFPDDYGAVTGSFMIPKTAATGEWEITSDYLDIDYGNSGAFSVEEYKRPTYELKIDKPDKTYMPGDTIRINVNARSFAGSKLANTGIGYKVDAAISGREKHNGVFDRLNIRLLDSSGYTDAGGALVIAFVDTALQRLQLNGNREYDITYNVKVEATDATGESHSANISLNVSSRPVSIRIPIQAVYHADDWRPLLLKTVDPNGLELSRKVNVKLYRQQDNGKKEESDFSTFADQWIFSREEWQKQFPDLRFKLEASVENKKEKVYETIVNTTAHEKLRIPKELLVPGIYILETSCVENGKVTGEASKTFTLFSTSGNMPGNEDKFFHAPSNWVSSGDTLTFYSGFKDSTYAITEVKYLSSANKKPGFRYLFFEQQRTAGITAWKWKVPKDVVGKLLITNVFIRNNELFNNTKSVIVNSPDDNPQIIVEQFRNILAPGSSTSFSVSVKTKDKQVAAEIMSSMYDASLDRIEEHKWNLPGEDREQDFNDSWPYDIHRYVNKVHDFAGIPDMPFYGSSPVWWLSERNGVFFLNDEPGKALSAALISGTYGIVSNGYFMDEVIVAGYDGVRRVLNSSVTGVFVHNITTESIGKMTGKEHSLVLLDGVPVVLDDKYDLSEVTDGLYLRGSDAVGIYGSKAAGGILVLSTKGPVKIPDLIPEVVVKPRVNFNETAFFLPRVHADRDGYYHFSFTMPESVTEWNWKLLAHTKDGHFAYAEKKLVTKLSLMVQPNMPRLLNQGDRIVLQTRISNTDTLSKTGKITCKIEDEVTGEDITDKLLTGRVNEFSVGGFSTTSSPFTLTVPAQQLNPIKVTIAASSDGIADAEAHSIPVLSKKMLVKESIPVHFRQSDTTINVPGFKGAMYGVGLSINPVPQSGLINALAFLSNYSYNCAEQTFNKFLAHLQAIKLMRTDSSLQRMWPLVNINADNNVPDKLPATPAETTPWLSLSNKTKDQQSRLHEILDTVRSVEKMTEHFKRLITLQNNDGGLTWFDGGLSDRYISSYVLSGFGKIERDHFNLGAVLKREAYPEFIARLRKYCYGQVRIILNTSAGYNYDLLNLLYAQSFWQTYDGDSLYAEILRRLSDEWTSVNTSSLNSQAMLITVTLRMVKDRLHPLHIKAVKQLESLRQMAIDDENGIRWKDLSDVNDLLTRSEETIALLSEAFEEGSVKNLEAGIVHWLLSIQKEHHWGTTKGTAAAIGLLQRNDYMDKMGDDHSLGTLVNKKTLKVNNGLLNGNLFDFMQTTDVGIDINVHKTGAGDAAGNIELYYFRDWDKITNNKSGVVLNKELSCFRNNEWIDIKEGTELRLGEKVRVELHIETPRSLRYVYIDDKRPAAFEPNDAISGNEYGRDFSYYRSVRDAGFQFFSSFLPPGNHTISYELTVAQEGEFTSGPASLECMYRPEVGGYSNIIKVKTVK